MSALARHLDTDDNKEAAASLLKFFRGIAVHRHAQIMIPNYWATTVHNGLLDMVEEFPHMKVSYIREDKFRLKILTIPINRNLENLAIELANKVDDLILNSIDIISKADRKPLWL